MKYILKFVNIYNICIIYVISTRFVDAPAYKTQVGFWDILWIYA